MSSWKGAKVAAAVLGAVATLACGPATPRFNGQAVEPPAAAPELAGTNWDGAPFALADLGGRAVLVFFGYTYCPDVCPLTLAKMKQVLQAMGEDAARVAVVFVSVDPDRDSLEKLAAYVPAFDERFYGVRIEGENLLETKDAWSLTIEYSQPKEGPNTDSYYYVDHTGTYFLIDPQGRLRVKMAPNAGPEAIAADLAVLLQEAR